MELTIEQALQKGVTAHKEGKLQDAEHLYRAILQSQPAHPDANHNLGLIAVAVNKADAALALFKTALEANPKIEKFWLSYIDTLIKEKQFENAKLVIDWAKMQGVAEEKLNILEAHFTLTTQVNESKLDVHKKSPTLPETRKKLVKNKKNKKATKQNVQGISPSQEQLTSLLEYYQNGRFHDAEKLSVSITKKFPKHQFGWKALGAVLNQLGRIPESVVAKEKAVKLAPNDAEARYNLGVTLKELGRLDEAEASYTQAITLKPHFAEAHNNLGNMLQELGRLNEAEESCRQAIALKPDYAEAHSNLGAVLTELGRLDDAEVSLKQAIALKNDYALARYNLGITLHELGRLDEAEASYTHAIALKPKYAQAHNNLGNTLKELGKLDEAEASYTQAIALMPGFITAIRNRCILLFNKKEFESALRDADLCISKGSVQLDLTSLYALGRIEDIYKRIEERSKTDGENISIAAFAAFIAEAEKKPTVYNFCPKPIDFIHVANLSSHVNDPVAYTAGLIEELGKIQTIWEPFERATVGGFQTQLRKNLFKNTSKKIAQLKTIIINEIKAYHLKFHNDSCSYIQKLPSGNNFWGWHVVLKRQGHQTPHIHTKGWLSGVIYLKVVPSLGKNEGAIEFSLNGEQYHDVHSPSLTFQPEVGDIVFFPSSLHHRTIPFTTDTDRIIVSFDLIPEIAGL